MATLRASVGKRGVNHWKDVYAVQKSLKEKKVDPGPIDGYCGPKTITAIRKFQAGFLRYPDGLVEVGGTTWKKLSSKKPETVKIAPSVLSGQWTGDSSKWTQDKKLKSLEPTFRLKVQKVLNALKDRGFQPKIFYGWRSVTVQQEIYKRGRSKVKFSFHNAQKKDGTPNSYAADIIDKRWAWDKKAMNNGFWNALGEEAKKQGLVWGGDWKSFRDYAHIQGRRNSELADIKRESGL